MKRQNNITQKIRVTLLMIVVCVSSFFVTSMKEKEHTNVITGSGVRALQKADAIYNHLDFGQESPLSRDIFRKAYIGYLNLRDADKLNNDQPILSICDFSLSANVKRLWIIDLKAQKILFHSLVAHGQGTGEEFAAKFSNRLNSHQSSMGFYVTENTYTGDNGYSLKLHGMDRGYNDAAYNRAIVMHGADYVSESFIKNNQRLGRSWGCPAVPQNLAGPIIDAIKDKTCLYIYFPDEKYLASSTWLNKMPAISEEELIREKYVEKSRERLAEPTVVAPATTAEPISADGQTAEQPAYPQYMGVKLAVGGG